MVVDDMGNIGKVKSIDGDDVVLKLADKSTVEADIDDLKPYTGDSETGGDAEDGEDGEPGALQEGDKVQYTDDGETVVGRITGIKKNEDGTPRKYKVETPDGSSWVAAAKVSAVAADGDDDDDDDDD
jgi:hypothetical protein